MAMLGYSMDAAASGSNDALQIMQNIAAAPNVQQEAQLKLQADQAAVEKAKLSNLVTQSAFKSSEDSKAKLQQLAQSPEFKAADDAGKLRMSAAIQMQTGDIENGAKTLLASENFEAKKVADQQKQLDLQAQQVGNAYGVISSVPDDKVQEFVDRLPAENKQALISQIGKDNWDKMSGAEKKEAAKNLMLNAKGQMATQLKQIDLEKTRLANESRERIAAINATARIQAKMLGGGGSEMKEWNTYMKAQEHIEKSGEKPLAALDKKVEEAQALVDKKWFPGMSGATDKLNAAIKERDEFKRKQVQKEIDLATSAPNFPGKEAVIDNLKKELELYGGATPSPIPKEQEEAKPAATAKPKAGDTSNKLTAEQQATVSKAEAAIKAGADPQKVKERLKQAGIPGY